jgi:hypothetical protein
LRTDSETTKFYIAHNILRGKDFQPHAWRLQENIDMLLVMNAAA